MDSVPISFLFLHALGQESECCRVSANVNKPFHVSMCTQALFHYLNLRISLKLCPQIISTQLMLESLK